MTIPQLIASGMLLAAATTGLAENELQRLRRVFASPKEMHVQLVDETGAPVQEATASLIIVKANSGGLADKLIEIPDHRGEFIARAPAYFGFDVLEVKSTAKGGKGSYGIAMNNHDYVQYDVIRQDLRLTLPHILDPIPLRALDQGILHRRFNGPNDKSPPDPRLPDFAESTIGFDAENCEAVPPFGRGKTIDFYVVVKSVYLGSSEYNRRTIELWKSLNFQSVDEAKSNYGNWTHTLTLRFPNPGDGAVLSPEFWPYCVLRMPHQAPTDGYVSELSLTETEDHLIPPRELEAKRRYWVQNGFFLRVRSQVDPDGRVISAHYAKIVAPHLTGLYKQVLRWSFFYNPTPNDRNLEYDFKRNLLWEAKHPPSTPIPPLDHHEISFN